MSAGLSGARAVGRVARVLAAGGAAALLTSAAGALQSGEGAERAEDETPRRVVRVFDFDDERWPDPVPPEWVRTTLTPEGEARPGFPPFNRAQLDLEVSKSGARSMRLPTQGGSTSLRLKPGEVPIFADADYSVSAEVRTEDLSYARAFVVARLLDQELKPIAGSEVRSDAVATGGLWKTVSVQLRGGHEGAAWLQIDLDVLQPRQYEQTASEDPAVRTLLQHKVWREDVRGAAWFDDVRVMQIPRATLRTGSPANIIRADEPTSLVMMVRDLGGDALRARVRVEDVWGRVVAEHETAIDPGGRAVTWAPEIARLGWYRAVMDVSVDPRVSRGGASDPRIISQAEVRFIRLPGRGGVRGAGGGELGAGGNDRSRFGVVAESTSIEETAQLPELVARLGTGFLHLPIWYGETTLDTAAGSLAARRGPIEAMLRQGQGVTLVIDGLPAELGRKNRVPTDDALALGSMDRRDWMSYLMPTLDIFGQRLTRYQVGGTGDTHGVWRANLAGDLDGIRGALATMVPGPTITLPWTADRAIGAGEAAGADALTLTVPVAFGPESIGEALAPFQRIDGDRVTGLTVVLELPEAERFAAMDRVTDLARRTVEFWRLLGSTAEGGKALADARLAIHQPWSWREIQGSEAERIEAWPAPEAAALSTLMERLSGRRIVGELRSSPGVRCYILAARNPALGTLDRGALIAWNESAEASRASVDAAAIGAGVTVVDLFGNQTFLASGSGRGSGNSASPLITVPVDAAPVFIEGVDPYLALFAASFRLEPSFMPAVVREHEHRIILTNPWPLRITGKLQLKEERGEAAGSTRRSVMDEWRISPSGIIDFDMAPGQTLSVPVTLWFGAGQLAGTKEFVIVARATADRAYPPVRLRAAIEVGLDDIDMNPELQVTDDGDVVVIAAVTNRGTRPRTLRLETAAYRMPSQQLQVSDLPPGQTVLRRFVFKGGAAALTGRRVVVSLSDPEEAERLNKAVQVP